MPSERELMQALDATYGLVRMANQFLLERGIIDRRHGVGTFLARNPAVGRVAGARHQRLALLYVDHPLLTHPFIEHLTLDLQRVTRLRGYELTISEWCSPDPHRTRLPYPLDSQEVDGVVLYGDIRQAHLDRLTREEVPFVVVHNAPMPPSCPQVRPDGGYRVTYEITRELLQAGFAPVWLDANPAYVAHPLGLERIRGYTAACETYGDGQTYLCDVQARTLETAVKTLLQEDLGRAALIVHDWSAPLLPAMLRMHSPDADRLLLVPASYRLLGRQAPIGATMMQWTRRFSISLFSEAAVHGLVDRIEGHRDDFVSRELNVRCKLLKDTDPPRMQATWSLQPVPVADQDLTMDVRQPTGMSG